MKIQPLQDVSKSPARKPTRDPAVTNAHGDLVLPVGRMEVRRIVVAVEDCDRDTEEAADDRHARTYTEVEGRRAPGAGSCHVRTTRLWPSPSGRSSSTSSSPRAATSLPPSGAAPPVARCCACRWSWVVPIRRRAGRFGAPREPTPPAPMHSWEHRRAFRRRAFRQSGTYFYAAPRDCSAPRAGVMLPSGPHRRRSPRHWRPVHCDILGSPSVTNPTRTAGVRGSPAPCRRCWKRPGAPYQRFRPRLGPSSSSSECERQDD